MSQIEFKLPLQDIKNALDYNAETYVQKVWQYRRDECMQAIGEILEEHSYLPTDTYWYVEDNRLWFSVDKDGAKEDLAHYFHEGMIYGPNIPVFREYTYVDGRRVGLGKPYRFVSPRGQKKYPTGEYLDQYEGSPMGVQHWTEAVENGGELFEEVCERCEEILRR